PPDSHSNAGLGTPVRTHPGTPPAGLQAEFLPDVVEGYAVVVAAGGGVYALDRLQVGFAAEGERLVVNGKEELRARIVRHAPGLFRSAVVADPRGVGAHRH